MYNPINKYIVIIAIGAIAMLILMTVTTDVLQGTAADALGNALTNS